MPRSRYELEPVCAWCGRDLVGDPLRAKTLPEFTRHRSLTAGVLVAVCGERCPKRPVGAPVGSRLASCPVTVPTNPGRLFDLEPA